MAVTPFNERAEGFNVFLNHEGQNIRLDPPLAHSVLSLFESAKKTNGDVVIVVDGEEGSGKSTLARQIAKFLDPTFTEERMEFTPEDAIKAHFKGLPDNWHQRYDEYKEGLFESKPWQAIILDESADLDRKKTMSSNSIEFTSFLTQSRQLHKIFIVVLPSIHILNSYVAEHRAVCLIHCFKHERVEMGFYRWGTRKTIKEIFSPQLHRQKMYPRNWAFSGRFSGREAFDITKYKLKKAKALDRYRKIETVGAIDPDELLAKDREKIMETFLKNGFKDDKIIYTCLGMHPRMWRRLKATMKDRLGMPPDLRGRKKRVAELTNSEDIKPKNDEYEFWTAPEDKEED